MPSPKPTKRETESSSHLAEMQNTVWKLEEKYLGDARHISEDKYFRMLLRGMTQEETNAYVHAKLEILRASHFY